MKLILCLALSILSLASPVWAAITFDAVSSSSGTTSSSHSHTVAADANIAIICLAIRDTGGAVAAATGVTVGGAAATLVTGGAISNAGAVVRTEMWYKLAPATGAQTVAVTANANTDVLVTGVMTFKGVAQTSTFNTASTAEGMSTNADVDSIASAVGEMGVYCGNARTETTTAAADATAPVSTERYETSANSPGETGFGYTEDGAVTSINMRVDLSASVQWAAVGVSMRAAADTRRPSPPILMQ